ncbi:hypothetical protein MKX08_004758 [Trichoderma sp. CBMAI-0020]|nr:hypothetical protein MKX08_004758 [Trichoderma sp. CBMAI-0020]
MDERRDVEQEVRKNELANSQLNPEGGRFAGTKHDQVVGVLAQVAFVSRIAQQLTRRETVAALLVRARTDGTGQREKKKTEAKKKLPRIVDGQDNEA